MDHFNGDDEKMRVGDLCKERFRELGRHFTMAQLTVYVNEPTTRGKVVLNTSFGPLDVELWSKEAPLACRNFVQLCMEGYYDGCIFHRVIKGFMAQTGDPTGTGNGGESIFGEPFKDECHGRLRFTHRGLLAMASSGPDTNGSQFFITLDRCEWLENKHTIFGKITGNSLYNLGRFDELEIEANDRPAYPPRIEGVEILLEPFDDIVPRQKVVEAPSEPVKKKRKEKKNLSLLSFGEEAAEEEKALAQVEKKAMSSHDVLKDPRLSKQQAVDTAQLAQKLRKRQESELATEAFKARAKGGRDGGRGDGDGDGDGGGDSGGGGGDDDDGVDFTERMRMQMQQKRQRLQAEAAAQAAAGASASVNGDSAGEGAGEEGGRGGGGYGAGGSSRKGRSGGKASAVDEHGEDGEDAAGEYERLRKSLAMAKRAEAGGWKWRGKGVKDSDDDDDDDADDDDGSGLSVLEQRRRKFLEKRRQSAGLTKKQRQEATLHKLGAFKKTLGTAAPPEADWKAHTLKYEKESREAESASVYESVDPLKHGADESRALAKIKEREKVMQSMKKGWADDD